MKLLSLTTAFLLKAVLGQPLEPSGQGNLVYRNNVIQEAITIHNVSFSEPKGPAGANIEFRVSIADDKGSTINEIQCSSKEVTSGYEGCSDKNYRFFWAYYEIDRKTYIRMYHEPDRFTRLEGKVDFLSSCLRSDEGQICTPDEPAVKLSLQGEKPLSNQFQEEPSLALQDLSYEFSRQGMHVVSIRAVKFRLVGGLYGSKSYSIDCSAGGAELEPDRPCSNPEYTFTLTSLSWPWNHEITITHQDPKKGTLKGKLRFEHSCHGPEGRSDGNFQCDTPYAGIVELYRA